MIELKDIFNFTPTYNYDLLHTQLIYMQDYLNTLETRAIKEGIGINYSSKDFKREV